jgi:putative transposase
VSFVHEHKERTDGGLRWGVESICRVLCEHGWQIAPATYYAARSRPPSARAVRDEALKAVIGAVHQDNYGVYGVRKMQAALRREKGLVVGRDQVGRLMRELGLQGVRRGKPKRTTVADDAVQRAADLVRRQFSASRPDQLWVCDLTYCRTWAGFAYLALVIDVFSRRIVGWALTTHMRTDLTLEALEMAIWVRDTHLGGLVHHTDRGSQYTAIRYTDTLAGAGALPSVGSVGDSYDNALAESTIGQIKAELIHRRGPWRTAEQLEFALFEYLDWWNQRRLHGELGMITPAEKEAAYYTETGQAPPPSTPRGVTTT